MISTSPRNLLQDTSASSMIEMGFVMPVFFLMVFGFINFALVMFGTNNITYADRAALRYASMHSSTSQTPATLASVTAAVNTFVYRYPVNTTTTTLTYGTGGNIVGGQVTVKVTVLYTISLPFMHPFSPTLVNSATSTIVQ